MTEKKCSVLNYNSVTCKLLNTKTNMKTQQGKEIFE